MHNIALSVDFGNFYRSLVGEPFKRRQYGAISYHALALAPPAFVLYSLVAVLANFRTRIADLRWRRGQLRSWRSGRQIRRLLRYLEGRFLVRYGPERYSLRGRTEQLAGSRIRPVNMHVLRRVRDERTALYVKFVLWLAWLRRPWSEIRLSDVQEGLRIRRNTAAGLMHWLRTEGLGQAPRALRRVVFFAVRPEWWRWVRRRARGRDSRRDGAGELRRFPNVRQCLGALAFASETGDLTGTGPPGPAGSAGTSRGGRPADSLPCGRQARKAGGQSSAGRSCPLVRRSTDSREVVLAGELASGNWIGSRDAGRTLEPIRETLRRLSRGKAEPARSSLERPGAGRHGAGALTVDELVGGMPKPARVRFRSSFAGRAARYLAAVARAKRGPGP